MEHITLTSTHYRMRYHTFSISLTGFGGYLQRVVYHALPSNLFKKCILISKKKINSNTLKVQLWSISDMFWIFKNKMQIIYATTYIALFLPDSWEMFFICLLPYIHICLYCFLILCLYGHLLFLILLTMRHIPGALPLRGRGGLQRLPALQLFCSCNEVRYFR